MNAQLDAVFDWIDSIDPDLAMVLVFAVFLVALVAMFWPGKRL